MNTSHAALLDLSSHPAVFARVTRDAAEWRMEEIRAEHWDASAAAIADHDGALIAAQRLAARTRYRGPVTLLVPEHLLLAKHVALPAAGGARRDKALQFAAAQAIPYPLEEVVWDSLKAGETAAGTDVLLLAAKREPVERLCAAAEAAGFAVESALPALLAMVVAHRLLTVQDRPPELLLTLGERSHELVLVRPEGFHLRIFAAPGGVGDESAARLAEETERTLRHFRAEGTAPFARPELVWLGGPTATPGLASELSARLGMRVERRMVAPAAPPGSADVPGDLRWRLVGAAAIASRMHPARAELLPPSRREQLRWRRRTPGLAVATALLLAALLPPIAHQRAEAAAWRGRVAQLEAELAPPRARDAHNRAQLARLAELRRQVALLEELEDRRSRWVGLLADLQERLSEVEEVWFDRMEIIAVETAESGSATRLRLAISSRMLVRATAGDEIGAGLHGRVQALFARLADSPFVAAVEGERIDRVQPGIVRIEFELVARGERLL